MTKEEALTILDSIEGSLRKLRAEIRHTRTKNINRKATRDAATRICNTWFEDLEPSLSQLGVSDDVWKKHHELFSTLLQLAIKTSYKVTYLKVLDQTIQDFKDELFIPVMKSAGQVVLITHLTKILENATDEERDYLNEALGCAGRNFFRASVVLGWSAAVHRMHRIVEKHGFEEFNKKSEEMRNITDGRFKRFKKSFNVQSLSDLRVSVFDNDLLWVLEYWGLIDANQHDRLSICFTMRNNSAHPGEAQITEENLASFYSDLKNMVFDNQNFKL